MPDLDPVLQRHCWETVEREAGVRLLRLSECWKVIIVDNHAMRSG